MLRPEEACSSETLLELTRQTLRRALEAIEKSRYRLRIPKIRGPIQRMPGKPTHSVPELFLQLSGQCWFRFPEEEFRLRPGEICLVPRNMPHWEETGPFRGPFYNLVFLVSPRLLSYHLAGDGGRPGKPHVLQGASMKNPSVTRPIHYADDLVDAFQKKGPTRDSAVKGLLLAYLASILLILEGQATAVTVETKKVLQTRELVNARLGDPNLSVKALAESLDCNADYLSSLFFKETGSHLSAFVTEQRLLEARHLLTESTLNVSQVAAQCGFADPSYFTRLFHRSIGQTPKEYQRLIVAARP